MMYSGSHCQLPGFNAGNLPDVPVGLRVGPYLMDVFNLSECSLGDIEILDNRIWHSTNANGHLPDTMFLVDKTAKSLVIHVTEEKYVDTYVNSLQYTDRNFPGEIFTGMAKFNVILNCASIPYISLSTAESAVTLR
jgi:hypothetical protein